MTRQCNVDKKWSIVASCLTLRDRTTQYLPKNAVNHLAEQFNVSRRCIQSIHQQFKDKSAYNIIVDMKPKRRTGRKSKCTPQKIAMLVNVNQEEDGDVTYKELEAALEELGCRIPSTSCYRYLKSIGAKTISSFTKPTLTDENKMQRLRWVLKQIITTDPTRLTFLSQKDRIHIDEKWFYLERLRVKRQVIPGQPRFDDETVGHKSHRTKVKE